MKTSYSVIALFEDDTFISLSNFFEKLEDAENKLYEVKEEDVGMFDRKFGQYAILKTMIKTEVLKNYV